MPHSCGSRNGFWSRSFSSAFVTWIWIQPSAMNGSRCSPSPGKHWFWFGGRPFEVWFSRADNTRERGGRRLESLTFRTLGRNRTPLRYFVEDVVRCHIRSVGVQSCLYMYDDGWDYVAGYSPRVLESVLLEPGSKNSHASGCRSNFVESKQRYARLGVPYHRGYLFYGPPGTGERRRSYPRCSIIWNVDLRGQSGDLATVV